MEIEDIARLLEQILSGFLLHPVRCVTIREPVLTILAHVSREDMPRIVGKDGKTIHAIRTLIHCMAAKNGLGRINFNAECQKP